jgi:hypothetical protein
VHEPQLGHGVEAAAVGALSTLKREGQADVSTLSFVMDDDDAEGAVRQLDGIDFQGQLTVQEARGSRS